MKSAVNGHTIGDSKSCGSSRLADSDFLSHFRDLAARERRITLEILRCINELEYRRCHLGLGFASAFDFLTRDLGYSESAAWRRIQSARLLRKLPELETKIESGAVSVTALADAQRIFRAEEKRTGQTIAPTKKLEAVAKIERQSTRSAQMSLHAMFPQSAIELAARSERLRVTDSGHIRVHVTFTHRQMEKLKRLRDVLSHRNFGASFAELVEVAVDHFLDQRPPKPSRKRPQESLMHGGTGAGVAARSASQKRQSGLRRFGSEASQFSETISKSKPPKNNLPSSNSAAQAVGTRRSASAGSAGANILCAAPAAVISSQTSFDPKGSNPAESANIPLNRGAPAQTRAAPFANTRQNRGSRIRSQIPARTRKYVFDRDRGRCQFKRGDEVCGSQFQIEVDHVVPRAQGGTNTAENLRLLCRAHNQHEAEASFGKAKMQRFRKH